MLTPFILFFGLTVATAVIAYWSDNLGKKLGKKRVSLFGLRPRTTATVLTVVSSWGIMLCTILVLLIVVEPLRSALFRFDRERRIASDLRGETQKLQAQKANLLGRNKQLGEANQFASQKLNTANSRLQIATASAASARNDARDAETKASLASKERQRAESARLVALNREQKAREAASVALDREALSRRLAEREGRAARASTQQAQLARQKLASTRGQLSAASVRLTSAQTRLQTTESQLGSAKLRLDKAQKNLVVVQAKLKRASLTVIAAGQDALKAWREVKTAQNGLAAAKDEVNQAQREVLSLQEQRRQIETDTKTLIDRYQEISQQLDDLYEQFTLATRANVTIGFEQTLAARLVNVDESATRIETSVRQLMRDGQIYVTKVMPDATLSLSSFVLPNDNKLVVLRPQEVVSGLVDYISQKRGQVSVRLVAVRNFSKDEKRVTARFVVVDVTDALPTGELLAQGNVDGAGSDAAVFSQLLDLVDAGRKKATDSRISPPLSPEQPNFYSSNTNELIFQALHQVRQMNRPALVKIVSAAPLSSVDPIQVRFVVEKVS